MDQTQFADSQRKKMALPKPERDVYAVIALCAAVASIGFLLGPALTIGFGFALAVTAVITGMQSRSGATVATGIGALVAVASFFVLVVNSS